MSLSVILSTYNSPSLLRKALCGYSVQTYRPFDIVIADDGSTDETRRLIDTLRRELGLQIRHVWQEDDGFRKCAILNKAIQATTADYLVFSDGDCVPRSDFLAVHVAMRKPGHFLSGGYFKLPRSVSEDLSCEDVLTGRATDTAHLRDHGLNWSWRHMRLHAGPRLGRLLDLVTPTKATWNGHNASGWRADILRVNGFDERMRYGGEDRELGERLMNLGIRARQIRHRAICVHLWHERGYVRDEDLRTNRAIRRETARHRAQFTPYGIVKRPAQEEA